MRKLIAIGTILLMALLFSQVVYAQYGSNGALTLSNYAPLPGETITVSGTGFMTDSDVHITIQSTPVALRTVTADGAGSFSTTVRVPSGYSGSHEIVATGIAPDASVRVLASTIEVNSVTLSNPPTDAIAGSEAAIGTHPAVTGFAIAGVLLVTALALVALRRRTASR